MSSVISLEGLMSNISGDNRAIAILKVEYNNNVYDWKIYVDPNVDITEFIKNCNSVVEAQIDGKEAEWAALNPKTRTITDPFTNEEKVVDIPKEEIVQPEIPDYKFLRKSAYPEIGDQLDALWKGYATPSFTDMQLALYDAKIRFPKGISQDDKLNSIKTYVWNKIMAIRQKVLEGGAKLSVNGEIKWFNSDTFSRTQWLGMVVLGDNLPPNITWKTMDGSFVTLNPSLVKEVFTAIMTKEIMTFGNSAVLYNEVMTSSDPLSVDINKGWPESYE